MSEAAPFNPELLLRTLAKHGVEFVLIGAVAARLHGFPRTTADTDITPARGEANLERLAAALGELEARVFTESVPQGLDFDRSAAALGRADQWNLVTTAGRVDLIFKPAGTGGFDDLVRTADQFEAYGHEFAVASLQDIIRSKQAADRPQDRQDVIILREMLRREG